MIGLGILDRDRECRLPPELLHWAEHSFTLPGSEKVGMKGMAYNENSDRRSWQDMQNLFVEVFAKK